MVVEKRRFTVYGLQPYDIYKKQRIKRSKLYIGYSNRLGNRLRNHLLLTPGTRGSWKTLPWVKKFGAVCPYFFVTGFTDFHYALSFETSVTKLKLPRRERHSLPSSIRRLIRTLNKTTWSKCKNIPNADTLPKLVIHWIRPEFKPKKGSYVMDFPKNRVKHVYHPDYSKIEDVIANTNLSTKDKKQQIQNVLHLNNKIKS